MNYSLEDEDDQSYGYPESDGIENMLTKMEMLQEVSQCTNYWEYVNTRWWRKLSDEILKRDLETCQDCDGVATVVHHLEYPKIWGHEDPDELISLCMSCHNRRHTG